MAVQSIAIIGAFWWTYLHPPEWVNQLHEDRVVIESSVERLEAATERLERINVINTTNSGNKQYVYVRLPLTDEELDHDIHLRALHAVWVNNYGEEAADALLYSGRERSEAGGTGLDAGGP